MRNNFEMKTPLFFRVWFAFVGLVIASIIGTTIYVAVSIVQAGPEGIGKAVGSIVKSYNDAAK